MKDRYYLFAVIIMLIICISSCRNTEMDDGGQNTPTISVVEVTPIATIMPPTSTETMSTVIPTPTSAVPEHLRYLGNKYNQVSEETFTQKFNKGEIAALPESFTFDLNADGVEETIELATYEYIIPADEKTYYEGEDDHVTQTAIRINGEMYTLISHHSEETYGYTYYGIRTYDNQCIIAVNIFKFPDDFTALYVYDGVSLKNLTGHMYDTTDITLTDGTSVGYNYFYEKKILGGMLIEHRMHFFKYPVSDSDLFMHSYKLRSVEEPYGNYALCDAVATVKCDLPVYKNKNNTEITGNIPAGDEILFLATDENEWIYVKSDLHSGWLRFHENDVLINETNIAWDEVFENYTICYDGKYQTEDLYYNGTSISKAADNLVYLPHEFVEDIGNENRYEPHDDTVLWEYSVTKQGNNDVCILSFTINDVTYVQAPVICAGKLSDVTLSHIHTAFGGSVLVAQLHYVDTDESTIILFQYVRNELLKIFEAYGILGDFIYKFSYISDFTVVTYEDEMHKNRTEKKYHFVDYWFTGEEKDNFNFEILVTGVPIDNFALCTYGTYAKKDFPLRKDIYSDEFADFIPAGTKFCIVATDGVEWCYVESADARGWFKFDTDNYILFEEERIKYSDMYERFSYWIYEDNIGTTITQYQTKR